MNIPHDGYETNHWPTTLVWDPSTQPHRAYFCNECWMIRRDKAYQRLDQLMHLR